MNNIEQTNIKLVVDDEQALYTTYSPEPEFNDRVRWYISTKAATVEKGEDISLTVISQKPLDEERFRTAAENWSRDEMAIYKKTEKDTITMLIGLLAFGSVMIVLSLTLVKQYTLLSYSILPIIGSFALSRVVRIMLTEIPVLRAKRRIIEQLEEKKAISFEYKE